jgi:hypothetical protein
LLGSLMPLSARLMGVRVAHFEKEAYSMHKYLHAEAVVLARCPVCSMLIQCAENQEPDRAIDRHLDSCLNSLAKKPVVAHRAAKDKDEISRRNLMKFLRR